MLIMCLCVVVFLSWSQGNKTAYPHLPVPLSFQDKLRNGPARAGGPALHLPQCQLLPWRACRLGLPRLLQPGKSKPRRLAGALGGWSRTRGRRAVGSNSPNFDLWEQISSSLGYRLVGVRARMPEKASLGSTVHVGVLVWNMGWAAPINYRPAEVRETPPTDRCFLISELNDWRQKLFSQWSQWRGFQGSKKFNRKSLSFLFFHLVLTVLWLYTIPITYNYSSDRFCCCTRHLVKNTPQDSSMTWGLGCQGVTNYTSVLTYRRLQPKANIK